MLPASFVALNTCKTSLKVALNISLLYVCRVLVVQVTAVPTQPSMHVLGMPFGDTAPWRKKLEADVAEILMQGFAGQQTGSQRTDASDDRLPLLVPPPPPPLLVPPPPPECFAPTQPLICHSQPSKPISSPPGDAWYRLQSVPGKPLDPAASRLLKRISPIPPAPPSKVVKTEHAPGDTGTRLRTETSQQPSGVGAVFAETEHACDETEPSSDGKKIKPCIIHHGTGQLLECGCSFVIPLVVFVSVALMVRVGLQGVG